MTVGMTKYPHMLINVIGLKVGWLACVLGGANSLPWLGLVVVAVVVGVHLLLADEPREELRLIAIVAGIGLFWDSLLVSAGLMQYPSGTVVPGFAPAWIVAMWVLFATALNVSLDWLKRSRLIAAVFGAVGGAMAFYGGHKLGGVAIPELQVGLAAQAAGWAAILPLLAWLATRFDGVQLTTAKRAVTADA